VTPGALIWTLLVLIAPAGTERLSSIATVCASTRVALSTVWTGLVTSNASAVTLTAATDSLTVTVTASVPAFVVAASISGATVSFVTAVDAVSLLFPASVAVTSIVTSPSANVERFRLTVDWLVTEV
jgi:hypothetical protein